ncbi:hypothetical protein TGPRC2_243635 [Toxoplasma gondii TgCatPRC2]|uniref:Uncharacterized protein n=1 Tax=Toxoplasma gondii TgCatPRC2 TaxID=1130821 RepID=A0A151HS07_TOXGO|nr:hypothetical protein TGPRC2_243635 [Toxoplasma gondii TgCatPRC2]
MEEAQCTRSLHVNNRPVFSVSVRDTQSCGERDDARERGSEDQDEHESERVDWRLLLSDVAKHRKPRGSIIQRPFDTMGGAFLGYSQPTVPPFSSASFVSSLASSRGLDRTSNIPFPEQLISSLPDAFRLGALSTTHLSVEAREDSRHPGHLIHDVDTLGFLETARIHKGSRMPPRLCNSPSTSSRGPLGPNTTKCSDARGQPLPEARSPSSSNCQVPTSPQPASVVMRREPNPQAGLFPCRVFPPLSSGNEVRFPASPAKSGGVLSCRKAGLSSPESLVFSLAHPEQTMQNRESPTTHDSSEFCSPAGTFSGQRRFPAHNAGCHGSSQETPAAVSKESWNDEGDDFVTAALLQGGECSRAQLAFLEEMSRQEEKRFASLIRLQEAALALKAVSGPPLFERRVTPASEARELDLSVAGRLGRRPRLGEPAKENRLLPQSEEKRESQAETERDGRRSEQENRTAARGRHEPLELFFPAQNRNRFVQGIPLGETPCLVPGDVNMQALSIPATHTSLSPRRVARGWTAALDCGLTTTSTTRLFDEETTTPNSSDLKQEKALLPRWDSNSLAILASALAKTLVASPRILNDRCRSSRSSEKKSRHPFDERGGGGNEEDSRHAREIRLDFASAVSPQRPRHEEAPERTTSQKNDEHEGWCPIAGQSDRRDARRMDIDRRKHSSHERRGMSTSFLDSWLRLCAADPLFQRLKDNRFPFNRESARPVDAVQQEGNAGGEGAVSSVGGIAGVTSSRSSHVRGRSPAYVFASPLSLKRRGLAVFPNGGQQGAGNRQRRGFSGDASGGGVSLFSLPLRSKCSYKFERCGVGRTAFPSENEARKSRRSLTGCRVNDGEGGGRTSRCMAAGETQREMEMPHGDRQFFRPQFGADEKLHSLSSVLRFPSVRVHSVPSGRLPERQRRNVSVLPRLLSSVPPSFEGTPHLHLHLSHVAVASQLSLCMQPSARVLLCCSVPVSVVGVVSTNGRETGRGGGPGGLSRPVACKALCREAEGEPLVEEDLVLAHCVKRERKRLFFDNASSHALRLGPPSPALARAVLRASQRHPFSSSSHSHYFSSSSSSCSASGLGLLSEAVAASVLLRQPLRFLLCASMRDGRASGIARENVSVNPRGILTSRHNGSCLERQKAKDKESDRLRQWGWKHAFPAAEPTLAVLAVGTLDTWSGTLLTNCRKGDHRLLSLAVDLHELSSLVPGRASGAHRSKKGDTPRTVQAREREAREETENKVEPRKPEVETQRTTRRQVDACGPKSAASERKLPVARLHIAIACTGVGGEEASEEERCGARIENAGVESLPKALRVEEGKDEDDGCPLGSSNDLPRIQRGRDGRLRSEDEGAGEQVDKDKRNAGIVWKNERGTGLETEKENRENRGTSRPKKAIDVEDCRESRQEASAEDGDLGGSLAPSIPPLPHAVPHLGGNSRVSSFSSSPCSLFMSSTTEASQLSLSTSNAAQAFFRPLHLLVHVGECSFLSRLRSRIDTRGRALLPSPQAVFCACKLEGEHPERSRLVPVSCSPTLRTERHRKRNSALGDGKERRKTTRLSHRSDSLSESSHAGSPRRQRPVRRTGENENENFHFTALSKRPFFWPSCRSRGTRRVPASSVSQTEDTSATLKTASEKLVEGASVFERASLSSDVQTDDALSPPQRPVSISLWTCRTNTVAIEFWATSYPPSPDRGRYTDTGESVQCTDTRETAGVAAAAECLGFLTCDVAGAFDRAISVLCRASPPRDCFPLLSSRECSQEAQPATTNRPRGQRTFQSSVSRQPPGRQVGSGPDVVLLERGEKILREFPEDAALARCRVALYAGPKEALETLAGLLSLETKTELASTSGRSGSRSHEDVKHEDKGKRSEEARLSWGRRRGRRPCRRCCTGSSARRRSGDGEEGRRTDDDADFEPVSKNGEGSEGSEGGEGSEGAVRGETVADSEEQLRENADPFIEIAKLEALFGVSEDTTAQRERKRRAIAERPAAAEGRSLLTRERGDDEAESEEKRQTARGEDTESLPKESRSRCWKTSAETPRTSNERDRRRLLESVHRRLLRDSLRGNDVWPVCWERCDRHPSGEIEKENGSQRGIRETEAVRLQRGGAKEENDEKKRDSDLRTERRKGAKEGGDGRTEDRTADSERGERIERGGRDWELLEEVSLPLGRGDRSREHNWKCIGRGKARSLNSKECLAADAQDAFVQCNLVSVRLACLGFTHRETTAFLDHLVDLNSSSFLCSVGSCPSPSCFSSCPLSLSSSFFSSSSCLPSVSSSLSMLAKTSAGLASLGVSGKVSDSPHSGLERAAAMSQKAEFQNLSLRYESSSRPLSSVSTAAPSPSAGTRRHSKAEEAVGDSSAPQSLPFSGNENAVVWPASFLAATKTETLCATLHETEEPVSATNADQNTEGGSREEASPLKHSGQSGVSGSVQRAKHSSVFVSPSVFPLETSSSSFSPFRASRPAPSPRMCGSSASFSQRLSPRSPNAIFIPLLHAYIEVGRQVAQLWALQILHPELAFSTSFSSPLQESLRSFALPAVRASDFFPFHPSCHTPQSVHSGRLKPQSATEPPTEESDQAMLQTRSDEEEAEEGEEEERRVFCHSLVERTRGLCGRARVAGRASLRQVFSRLQDVGVSVKDLAASFASVTMNEHVAKDGEQVQKRTDAQTHYVSVQDFEQSLSQLLSSPGEGSWRDRGPQKEQQGGDAEGERKKTKSLQRGESVGDSTWVTGRNFGREKRLGQTETEETPVTREGKEAGELEFERHSCFQLDRRRSQTLLLRLAGLYLALWEFRHRAKHGGSREAFVALCLLHQLIETSTAVSSVSVISSVSRPIRGNQSSPSPSSSFRLPLRGPWNCRCLPVLSPHPSASASFASSASSASSASALSAAIVLASKASMPGRYCGKDESDFSCGGQSPGERSSRSTEFFRSLFQRPSSRPDDSCRPPGNVRVPAAGQRLRAPVISVPRLLRRFSAFCERRETENCGQHRETRDLDTAEKPENASRKTRDGRRLKEGSARAECEEEEREEEREEEEREGGDAAEEMGEADEREEEREEEGGEGIEEGKGRQEGEQVKEQEDAEEDESDEEERDVPEGEEGPEKAKNTTEEEERRKTTTGDEKTRSHFAKGLQENEKRHNDSGEESMQNGRELRVLKETLAPIEKREEENSPTESVEDSSRRRTAEGDCRHLQKRNEMRNGRSVGATTAVQIGEGEAKTDDDKLEECKKAEGDRRDGETVFDGEEHGVCGHSRSLETVGEEREPTQEGERGLEKGEGEQQVEEGRKCCSGETGEDEIEGDEDDKSRDVRVAVVFRPPTKGKSWFSLASSSRYQGRCQVSAHPAPPCLSSRHRRTTFHRSKCRKCSRRKSLDASATDPSSTLITPSPSFCESSLPSLSLPLSSALAVRSRLSDLVSSCQPFSACEKNLPRSLAMRSADMLFGSLAKKEKERLPLSSSPANGNRQKRQGRHGNSEAQEREGSEENESDEGRKQLWKNEVQPKQAWKVKKVEGAAEQTNTRSEQTKSGKEGFCVVARRFQKKRDLSLGGTQAHDSSAVDHGRTSRKRVPRTSLVSRVFQEDAAFTCASVSHRTKGKIPDSFKAEKELNVSLRVPVLPPAVFLPAFLRGPETARGANERKTESRNELGV